ncbi:bromodomain 4 [Hibiscus trionum]|uniref:Bromodomain 4 n=1 Tax=Hibiscus trionum TaxID=183268 RepID=A0A9W7H888_HIBTR|nr:bromodomain 4 [Hibiscus trionum]
MGTEMITRTWGTWEELLLGGAVLRHGTRDWDLVASELRTRTVSPLAFTPEVCKAKYEALQRRYSGCKAWFEELRKQRMTELRLALEKSEDSIGSLESKLESLKAEKQKDLRVDYDSSQTESALPCLKSEGFEFSSKDAYKDGLSAGSFTQEAETNWAPDCQTLATVPAEEMDSKPAGDMLISKREKFSSIDKLADTLCGGQLPSIRKRRGKRKRKDCSKDAKEGSVGESEFLCSTDVASALDCKETSASNSAQIAKTLGVEDHSGDGIDDIMRIFSSIAENDCACVFRRRLDSQKRGRYKKMILRHMDFDTISSRIASNSITSVRELFRDMLLLANNALVFYSKSTREYKSAQRLRHIVIETLRQHLMECRGKVPSTTTPSSKPMHKPPAKPRSVPAGTNRKPPGNTSNNGNPAVGTSHGSKKTTKADSPASAESLAVAKKVSAPQPEPRKGGGGRASQNPETRTKGRKRA